jgi:hypothetical protein
MEVEIDVIRPAPPSVGDARRKKWFWFGIANVVSSALGAGMFAVRLVVPEHQDEARRHLCSCIGR